MRVGLDLGPAAEFCFVMGSVAIVIAIELPHL